MWAGKGCCAQSLSCTLLLIYVVYFLPTSDVFIFFFVIFQMCVIFFVEWGRCFFDKWMEEPCQPKPWISKLSHLLYTNEQGKPRAFLIFCKLTYFLHLSTRMLQLSGKVCPNFKDLSASFLNIKSCISFIFFLLSFLISIPRYHLCQDRHILLL